MVDPDDVHPASRERERVTPGPATDVEHPHAPFQCERINEELDLLFRAFRERVAQSMRPPERLGDLVEPLGWRRHTGHREEGTYPPEPENLLCQLGRI